MPVYIVEWPQAQGENREVSLVKCEPKQLADILDMVGDPYGCRVSRLKSTFFLTARVEGDCVDLEEMILSFRPEGYEANSHLMETMKDSHRRGGTLKVGMLPHHAKLSTQQLTIMGLSRPNK